jgi:hypothetical protein
LPRLQALIRLGAEVHGGIEELARARGTLSPRGMRRLLAGEATSRNTSCWQMHRLLRELWSASVLVSDSALATRCRLAVEAMADRAPKEVADAQKYGSWDADCLRRASIQESAPEVVRPLVADAQRRAAGKYFDGMLGVQAAPFLSRAGGFVLVVCDGDGRLIQLVEVTSYTSALVDLGTTDGEFTARSEIELGDVLWRGPRDCMRRYASGRNALLAPGIHVAPWLPWADDDDAAVCLLAIDGESRLIASTNVSDPSVENLTAAHRELNVLLEIEGRPSPPDEAIA